MNIAYFTDTFLPTLNGVVTSLVNLATGMADRGHNILICAPKTPGQKKAPFPHKGIDLILLPSVPAFFYPGLRIASPFSPALIDKIRHFKPDVIHLHSPFLVGGGAMLLGKLLKKPLVGSFHGYFMEEEYLKIIGFNGNTSLLTGALWKFAATFYNQCDHVVSPAEATKADLLTHSVHKPVTVIPNTINEQLITIASPDTVSRLRNHLGLPPHVLLYAGRLSKEKCLDVLLAACARCMQDNARLGMLIIGDGPIKHTLQQSMQDFGVGTRVVFTGEIDQQDLLTSGYYQLADVFVTASTSEVLPMTIIEAMYFGLPLIGVKKRGVYEMINGVGLVASPNDIVGLTREIKRVIVDGELRKKLSDQSRAAFEAHYASDQVVTKFESLYRSMRDTR